MQCAAAASQLGQFCIGFVNDGDIERGMAGAIWSPIVMGLIFRVFHTALAGLVWTGAAAAETLTLPGASPIRDDIARQCPDCLDSGFVACGSRRVGYGRLYAPNALQGDPAQGYLVTFVMQGAQFRKLARETGWNELVSILAERFRASRLVVIGAGFAAARVLPLAPEVSVSFPEALHSCVHDARKPWGCCVGGCGDGECCEKSLGSPRIELSWQDEGRGERLRFRFDHVAGGSTLTRETAAGRVIYHCLTDGRGFLK